MQMQWEDEVTGPAVVTLGLRESSQPMNGDFVSIEGDKPWERDTQLG